MTEPPCPPTEEQTRRDALAEHRNQGTNRFAAAGHHTSLMQQSGEKSTCRLRPGHRCCHFARECRGLLARGASGCGWSQSLADGQNKTKTDICSPRVALPPPNLGTSVFWALTRTGSGVLLAMLSSRRDAMSRSCRTVVACIYQCSSHKPRRLQALYRYYSTTTFDDQPRTQHI